MRGQWFRCRPSARLLLMLVMLLGFIAYCYYSLPGSKKSVQFPPSLYPKLVTSDNLNTQPSEETLGRNYGVSTAMTRRSMEQRRGRDGSPSRAMG
ncbi:unnamed protein product [Plutella xylostella]|uniref:(diamondback moth) hypothetical protein n=1 Tax=Plutella xylostella TaxID=51655 RepID=A0A8S4G8T1_PLUXY|nr:unnamed protein product [Plutella xylostella]